MSDRFTRPTPKWRSATHVMSTPVATRVFPSGWCGQTTSPPRRPAKRGRCSSHRTARSTATPPSSTSPKKSGICDGGGGGNGRPDRVCRLAATDRRQRPDPRPSGFGMVRAFPRAGRGYCAGQPGAGPDRPVPAVAGPCRRGRGQGPDRRPDGLSARRGGFPQRPAGGTPERRFRPDVDAAVPVRCLAHRTAAGAEDLFGSARGRNRGQGGKGGGLSPGTLGRAGDPAGRRHGRKPRTDGKGAGAALPLYRRAVHGRRRGSGGGGGGDRPLALVPETRMGADGARGSGRGDADLAG